MSRPAPSTGALVAGLLAVGALVLWLDRDVSFFTDEWDFLLGRGGSGPDVFLEPHHEHIALVPAAIYKALQAGFGMDSPRPFQVVSTLVLLSAIAVVWLYARRRVGSWLSLALVAPLAVCGPGWDNVLWPFQIGFTGSIATGVGALLALERRDRSGDLLACALLIASMSFSSLGVAFAVAVAVSIGLGSAAWRARAFVLVVPAVLFGCWWIGWGHEGQSFVSFSNLLRAPGFALDGFASGLATVTGAGTVAPLGETETLAWGRPLLVVALVAVALRLLWLGRIPRGLWTPLAFGLSFWLLTALNANAFRFPDTGRYQLIAAVAIVLIAAELLRGLAARRWVGAGVVAIAAIAIAGNLAGLENGRGLLRNQSQVQRGAFTAIEIARDSVDPKFSIGADLAGTPLFGDAGLYLAAVDEYGSPGYAVDELAAAPEVARNSFDRTLAAALRIELTPAAADFPVCASDDLGAAPVVRQIAAPQTLLIAAAGQSAQVALRRFGTEPVELGEVPADGARQLELPPDRSARRWAVELRGDGGTVRVCSAQR